MTDDAPAAPRKKKLSPGRILKLSLIATFLIAIAAEGLARVFVPPLPPIYCVHPYSNYVWSPELAIRYTSRRGEGPEMTLETDKFGFRKSTLASVEKPAGTRRIFFFGASVLAGVDLPVSETAPGIVEARLDQEWRGKARVECVNASLSGADIEKEFSDFAHLVLPFEPDAIVLYTGANDVLNSVDPRFDPTHYEERVSDPDRPMRWLSRRLRLSSYFAWKRLERGHNPFLERPPLEIDRPIESWPKFDPEPGFKAWRRYVGMIEAIARVNGVKLVLVTQASLWRAGELPERERNLLRYCSRYGDRIKLDDLWRLHRRYMDELRDMARKGGHLLVDGESLVPKTAEYFIDDLHFTPAGTKLLAGAIGDRLAQGW